jgi:hypothetical protein
MKSWRQMKARRVRANSPNYTRRYSADSFIPGRPGAPHPAIPNLLQFYEVLQRPKLELAHTTEHQPVALIGFSHGG